MNAIARTRPATIHALTIWQPWASLIIIGAKPYEFRSRPAPRHATGRRLGIHAGARPIRRDEVTDLIMRLRGNKAWDTCLHKDIALPFLEAVHANPGKLPLAHMLGIATLGPSRLGPSVVEAFGGPANAFGNDSDRDAHANYAWPLTEIEALSPPVLARGAQGLWRWNPGEA